jgi:hypothetical protein
MKYLIAIILLTNVLIAQEMPYGIKFQTPFEKTHEILSAHQDCLSSEDLIIFNNYEFKEYFGERVKEISTMDLNNVINYLNIKFDVSLETVNDIYKRIHDQLAERVYHFDTSFTKNDNFTESWSYSQEYNYLQVVLTKRKTASYDSCELSLKYWYKQITYRCFIDDDDLFGISVAAEKELVLSNLKQKDLYYGELMIDDKVYTAVYTSSICDSDVTGIALLHFNNKGEVAHIIIRFKEEGDSLLFKLLRIRYDGWYGKGKKNGKESYYWTYEALDHQYSVWLERTKTDSFIVFYQFK